MQLKHILFQVFRRVARGIGGKGLGLHRMGFLDRLYRRLFRLLSPSELTVVDVHGAKLAVNPADKTLRDSLLIFGTHEDYETWVLKSRIKPGMTFVDVGANVGYYTVISAALVGPSGRVFCFEPDALNYSFLQKSIALNGFDHVHPFQLALTDRAGKATLYLSEGLGSHSLGLQDGNTAQVEVDVARLDDLPALAEQGVDFIKIDVQGAELSVLKGSQHILSKWKPSILAEFEPRCLEKFGVSGDEFLNYVENLGYRITLLDPDARAQIPYTREALLERTAARGYLNILLEQGN